MKNKLIWLTIASSILFATPVFAGMPEPEYDSGNCVWRSTIASWEDLQTMSNLEQNAMRDGYDLSCDGYFTELKNAR